MFTAKRITICPVDATNKFSDLTRFDVDPTTATLRDVVVRIHNDPMLKCSHVRVGTTIAPYEKDAGGERKAGQLIDFFDPSIAFEPLITIASILMPQAGGTDTETAAYSASTVRREGRELTRSTTTAFAEGQELWLVVDGCATLAEAKAYIRAASLTTATDDDDEQRQSPAAVAIAERRGKVGQRGRADSEGSHRPTGGREGGAAAAISHMMYSAEELDGLRTSFEATMLLASASSSAAANGTGLDGFASAASPSAAASVVSSTSAALLAACAEGLAKVEALSSSLHGGASLGVQVRDDTPAAAASAEEEEEEKASAETSRGATTASAAFPSTRSNSSSTPSSSSSSSSRSHFSDTIAALARILRDMGTAANDSTSSPDGTTALHAAAGNGSHEVAEAIVKECGADIGVRSKSGATPLHDAAANGRAETVRALVRRLGADPSARDNKGNTPLHYAAQGGHVEVMRIFIYEFGANPATGECCTCKRTEYEVSEKFLCTCSAAAANFTHTSGSDRVTPLHSAAAYGSVAAILALGNEFGVDVSLKDRWGATPLHRAGQNGRGDAAAALAALGADVTARDYDCCTPLDLAAQFSHGAAISALGREIGDVQATLQ